MNRIQIKYRRRSSLITGHRIIAAHNQKISDPCPIQGIKLAFDLVAVLVFAGKMDERFDAQLQNFAAHEIGGHGRGSSRIVRQGQSIYFLPFGGLSGISQGFFLSRFSCASSRHQFPGDRKHGGFNKASLKLFSRIDILSYYNTYFKIGRRRGRIFVR